MIRLCSPEVGHNDDEFSPIAAKFRAILLSYEQIITTAFARLATAMDLRIPCDYTWSKDRLCGKVPLGSATKESSDLASLETPSKRPKTSLLEALDEGSLSGSEGEIGSFFRATARGWGRADHRKYRMTREKKHSSVVMVARDMLSVQATSVASKNCFWVASGSITDNLYSLSEDFIRASTRIKLWRRLISLWNMRQALSTTVYSFSRLLLYSPFLKCNDKRPPGLFRLVREIDSRTGRAKSTRVVLQGMYAIRLVPRRSP